MIFKQIPTMISDLNKLGIALKSLDAMKIGTVGVNIANVEAYRTALKGLSVEQSVFALASKGATEEQIRQILIINEATAKDVEAAMAKAGLTTATKALTQAEMIEIATKNGIAKAEAEELLRKIGITATEEGQVAVKKQVTLAMLEQAVASGNLTAAESTQIATMLGLNAVESTNIGITNVLTASFAKLWAVITAHPIGAILTAIGAVAVGTIAYINKTNKDAKKALVEAHETAQQALEDTKTSLSDDKSELQSINSELETTKQKIQEISSIGAPTLVEQNELNKLSTTNAQLEIQRTLLENNIKLKQKSAALDAKELLGTQVEMEYADILDGSSIESHNESYSYKEHAKYQASNLQNAYNIYMKALREGDVKKQQLAQELINASAGDSATLTSELLEIIESFKYEDGTIIEGYEKIYNEYMGLIYNLQSLTNPDTFLDIAKSVTSNTGIDYEKVISDAYKLAFEGNFDVDKLNQDFVKALSDAGIDESTIDYIFSVKQQEYQLLVDKINEKYKVSETPDKIRQDYWDANGNIHSEYIDVDEEIKKQIAEINTVNERLNEYAKENPVEFQLVSSFDDNFETLDKYIEEERIKAENTTDYVGDYITNAIKRIYDEAKVQSSTLNDKNPISSFQEAWASLDNITDSDSPVKDLKKDLLSLAEAGRLTTEAFIKTEGSEDFLSMLGIEPNDTQEINKLISKINELKSSADQLSSMKKGISGLSENLYNRQQNSGTAIDADTLAGMDSALKEQTAEWEKYVTVLGNASSSMEDVQKATDELATAYVNSNNFLANLTETNKDYYVSQLDAMGVANSAEVVEERLTAQKEVAEYKTQALSIATKDLADSLASHTQRSVDAVNATYENSKAFLKQSEMTDIAKISLADLIANEQIFASTDLNTSQKVSELNKLALAYFGVANAIQISSAMGADPRYWKNPGDYEKAVKEQWQATISDFSKVITTTISPKSPGNNNNSKNTTDNSKKEETEKEFSEVFDWIERRIKKFQKSFDKWIKQAETAVTSGFINKYYKKAVSVAKKELSTYSKAYNRYMAQANAVGLDKTYASKIRNGTIDIEEIYAKGKEEDVAKYEELAEKIKQYQNYYEKAIDCTTSFVETAEKLYNLPLDKAATKIEKFNDSIDLLDKQLANAIGSNKKNKLIDEQKTEEKRILNAYKTARTESQTNLRNAKKTLKKNKNLNADDGITKKERNTIKSAIKKNQEVNLSFFKENSVGYKAAVKYNEALKANKKAINDAANAQQDYNRYLVEAAKQKFDNVADDYNKEVQKLGWDMSKLDNKISEIEAAGKKVDKSYYNSQKDVNNKELDKYKAEKTALEKNLKKIKEGTDEWYDAKDEIQQVNNAISDCVKTTYELNNAINQLHFDLFDDISDGIKRIITEQEFLQGLFAHEKNADTETGNFTEAGLAKLGSLSASYYASKDNADRDKAMLKDLENVKIKGKQKDGSYKLGDWTFNSLDDLQKKIDEVYTKWQDDIKETYSLESGIVDVMKEKYQTELDLLKDLIDKKKEALNATKDLHDYNKTINEKTNDITTLQKQIAAYSGDSSSEGMAKLQKLQKELADKEEDLRETEYDKYLSDSEAMLDKLYDEYNELMSKKLDDFMTLVQEGLKTSNGNTAIIKAYLAAIAEKNGYKIETDGLFNSNGSSEGIKENTGKAIDKVDKDETSRSGTQDKKNTNTPSTSSTTETPEKVIGAPLAPPEPPKEDILVEKRNRSEYNGIVKDYISSHADKAKKDKKEYSDINQKIYENKAKSYKGTGKVLSSKELKGLAKKLGINYDGASKNGNLYKELKKMKFPGFKKGGVVSVDDIEKQVHENGDTSLVSVKNGEGILTQLQTAEFKKLAEEMPEMLKNAANLANMNWMLPISRSMPEISNARSMNSVVNIDTVSLPNVTNYKEFKEQIIYDIQTEKKTGMILRDVAGVNQLAGGGRMDKFRHKF